MYMENPPLFILKSKGTTENYINDNSKKHNQSFAWDIDYDGHQADVDVHLDTDGDEKHVQFQLDNEDLAKMLNYVSEPQNLEERLLHDFPLENTITNNFESCDETKMENPKIKIHIIPTSIENHTPSTSKYYIQQVKPRLTRKRKRKPRRFKTRFPSTRKLITGKIPSYYQRRNTTASARKPKTMRIKLHEVK